VKFCPKCEKVLKKKKTDNKIVLHCPVCGHEEPFVEEQKTKETTFDKKKMEKKLADNLTMVVDQKTTQKILPTTKVPCPKCGNAEAEFYQYQTRSADEPSTTFLTCTKCGYKWREY
jgi:transcription factor S